MLAHSPPPLLPGYVRCRQCPANTGVTNSGCKGFKVNFLLQKYFIWYGAKRLYLANNLNSPLNYSIKLKIAYYAYAFIWTVQTPETRCIFSPGQTFKLNFVLQKSLEGGRLIKPIPVHLVKLTKPCFMCI